jgi:hypothetical protein
VKPREEWRPVLEAEIKRWSEIPADQLVSALVNVHAYEVKFESKTYQIEVELLENTDSLVREYLLMTGTFGEQCALSQLAHSREKCVRSGN